MLCWQVYRKLYFDAIKHSAPIWRIQTQTTRVLRDVTVRPWVTVSASLPVCLCVVCLPVSWSLPPCTLSARPGPPSSQSASALPQRSSSPGHHQLHSGLQSLTDRLSVHGVVWKKSSLFFFLLVIQPVAVWCPPRSLHSWSSQPFALIHRLHSRWTNPTLAICTFVFVYSY